MKAEAHSRSLRTNHTTQFVALSILSIVLAFGCSENGGSGAGGTNGTGATGGDGTAPLFAVNYTTMLPNDQSTGFVNLTDSLEGTLEVRDAVLEAPGASVMYASPDIPGAFFIGNGEQPTITRYELSTDDTLVEVESVSFARFGLSRAPRFPALAPIVSADRAYVVDLAGNQVIEWNPTEMMVGKAIDLGDLVRDGRPPVDPFTVLVDDGMLYIPVSWYDFSNERTLPQSVLLVLDTETEQVHLHEDDRVSGIRSIYRTESGEVYVSSTPNFAAIFHRLRGENAATAPALLRVLDGERGYDPDFYVPLNDLAGGRTSSDVVPVADGRIIFSALHEDHVPPITDTTLASEVCLTQAWRYHTIELAETEAPGATATEVTDWPFTDCSTSFIPFEGRLFFVDEKEDSGALVDFTDPLAPQPTLTVAAAGVFFRTIARMR